MFDKNEMTKTPGAIEFCTGRFHRFVSVGLNSIIS